MENKPNTTLREQHLANLDPSFKRPWQWKSCLDKHLLSMVCLHCWKVGTFVLSRDTLAFMCVVNTFITCPFKPVTVHDDSLDFNIEVFDLQCEYRHYSRLPAWQQDLNPILGEDFNTPNLSFSHLPGQYWPFSSCAVSAGFAGQRSGTDTEYRV